MQNSPDVRAPAILRTAVALDLLVALVMRVLVLLRYRIDSDEPQHLHVVWEWMQGRLAYRDFYDNHLPLFHLAFVPLMRWIGEPERILLYSRLAMIPIALGALALTWLMARRFTSAPMALLVAISASLVPPFLLKGTEFRSDNVWTLLVLAAVAIAMKGKSGRHALFAGFVLGISAGVSIKTIHAIVAFGIATILVYGWRGAVRPLSIAFAGMCVVPAMIAIWFASHGALGDLWHWGVVINGDVAVALWRRVAGVCIFLIAFALSRRAARGPADRAMLAAFTAMFAGSVFALSPVISPRDLLPLYPLAIILLIPALEERPRLASALPLLLALLSFARGRLWNDPSNYWSRAVSQALAITRPGEAILDLKGETIFRPRATFIEYERVGREMVNRGLVEDRAAEDVVATRCYVATNRVEDLPRQGREFVERNFLSHGDLRVAGSRVSPDRSFTIAVPGRYSIVDEGGGVSAPRQYEAGAYRSPDLPPGAVVVWEGAARALRRGR